MRYYIKGLLVGLVADLGLLIYVGMTSGYQGSCGGTFVALGSLTHCSFYKHMTHQLGFYTFSHDWQTLTYLISLPVIGIFISLVVGWFKNNPNT